MINGRNRTNSKLSMTSSFSDVQIEAVDSLVNLAETSTDATTRATALRLLGQLPEGLRRSANVTGDTSACKTISSRVKPDAESTDAENQTVVSDLVARTLLELLPNEAASLRAVSRAFTSELVMSPKLQQLAFADAYPKISEVFGNDLPTFITDAFPGSYLRLEHQLMSEIRLNNSEIETAKTAKDQRKVDELANRGKKLRSLFNSISIRNQLTSENAELSDGQLVAVRRNREWQLLSRAIDDIAGFELHARQFVPLLSLDRQIQTFKPADVERLSASDIESFYKPMDFYRSAVGETERGQTIRQQLVATDGSPAPRQPRRIIPTLQGRYYVWRSSVSSQSRALRPMLLNIASTQWPVAFLHRYGPHDSELSFRQAIRYSVEGSEERIETFVISTRPFAQDTAHDARRHAYGQVWPSAIENTAKDPDGPTKARRHRVIAAAVWTRVASTDLLEVTDDYLRLLRNMQDTAKGREFYVQTVLYAIDVAICHGLEFKLATEYKSLRTDAGQDGWDEVQYAVQLRDDPKRVFAVITEFRQDFVSRFQDVFTAGAGRLELMTTEQQADQLRDQYIPSGAWYRFMQAFSTLDSMFRTDVSLITGLKRQGYDPARFGVGVKYTPFDHSMFLVLAFFATIRLATNVKPDGTYNSPDDPDLNDNFMEVMQRENMPEYFKTKMAMYMAMARLSAQRILTYNTYKDKTGRVVPFGYGHIRDTPVERRRFLADLKDANVEIANPFGDDEE